MIDLEGRRLIPGLIDGHVHVTGGGGEAGFSTRVPAPMLSRYTRAGVTSVVGLLGTDDVARSTRELVASIHALREQGLNAWGYSGGYHLPPTTLTGSVRGDIVFVDALIGVGEVAISDHRSSQPTLDELLRLASEAHVAGLMTGKAGIVHLHLGDGTRGLDAGATGAGAERVAGAGVQPDPRQPAQGAVRGSGRTRAPRLQHRHHRIPGRGGRRRLERGRRMAALSRQRRATGTHHHQLRCRRLPAVLRCATGRSAAWTSASPAPCWPRSTSCLRAACALAQALPAFTRNPATLLRLAGKGRIAPGCDADLVALDAGGAASDVWIDGVAHVRAGALQRRGIFEG